MSATNIRALMVFALLGSLGVGCPGDKDGEAKDSGGPPSVDLDKDGYGEGADCDDQSALIYPGAAEQCNGLDDDCDGETDEVGAVDGVPGYADADGDSYGASAPTTICPGTAGYVSSGGDCDDGSAAINPATEELCDGADNDCDGLTDEPGTSDGSTYYLDQDDDGYGHPVLTGVACSPTDGYAENNSDCDDQDPDRSPGNTEICSNRVDDDCDGTVDEADDAEAPTWYTDADGDGYGVADGPTLQSCDEPDGYADNTEDCDDSDNDVNPGERDKADGIDNDCDGEIDEGGGSVLEGGSGADWDTGGAGADFSGIFYVTKNFDCLNIYHTDAYEVSDEILCDGCDYSYFIDAEYNPEAAGIFGFPECDFADYEIWPEIDAFGTIWSFREARGSTYAYYYSVDSGEWYPAIDAEFYPDEAYGNWYFFYEELGRDYEAGIFLFSPYLYYYYGYYGYYDGAGGDTGDADADTGF